MEWTNAMERGALGGERDLEQRGSVVSDFVYMVNPSPSSVTSVVLCCTECLRTTQCTKRHETFRKNMSVNGEHSRTW